MSKQINKSQAYMPQRHTHTYYPIQTNKLEHHKASSSNISQNNINTSYKYEKPKEKQIDYLRRINVQLKQRQEIYLQKLMKLQEGLQNQHLQFIKLQDLYTELFQSYKQKELEIMELQIKYRETQRKRQSDRAQSSDYNKPSDQYYQLNHRDHQEHRDRSQQQYSFQQQQWNTMKMRISEQEKKWKIKQNQWKMKQSELNSYAKGLNDRIASLQANCQRITQELSFLKIKDKTTNSKAGLSDKTLQQLQQWQTKADNQKENRLKYQYENEFLKSRNNDLEKQREELEKLLTYKQQQILKLRQQKINIHRKSSQKIMHKSSLRHSQRSPLKTITTNDINIIKQINQSHNTSNNSMESNNHQYFSFSREKNEQSLESQLPSFPPELEIDSILNQHHKK